LIWDIYPDHLVRVGWLRGGGVMARFWRYLNRKAMLRASAVITIGDAMERALYGHLRLSVSNANIRVIPNWADTELLKPMKKSNNSFAVEQQETARLTVLYSGNIGRTHGLLSLIRAAESLKDNVSVSFLIVGDGLGLMELKHGVARAGLVNVKFLPYQPWERLPEVLAAGDVAVVSQAPGTEALSIPSKTYSYMAAGCALLGICEESSELGRLIVENGIGLVAPHCDPTRLVSHVERFSRDSGFLATCRANSRALAEREYGSEVALKRFEAALLPLFRGRRDAA